MCREISDFGHTQLQAQNEPQKGLSRPNLSIFSFCTESHQMSTKTIYQVCWRRHITSQAINVIVWSPKRQNIYYPDLRLKSWGGFLFFFCFSACQLLYILKQLPISHKVQLRFAKALHRCVPLIDVAIRICLVSSSPRYLFIA